MSDNAIFTISTGVRSANLCLIQKRRRGPSPVIPEDECARLSD
mgnify:CR=1 FL=1